LKRFSFPKKKRLLSNRQFKAVLSRDCGARDGFLAVYAAENDCGFPRLGISVGRAFGAAVARNRLKRFIREAFRQSQDLIPEGFDYVIMPARRCCARPKKTSAGSCPPEPTFEQIRASFVRLANTAVSRSRPRGQNAPEPPGKNAENNTQDHKK